MHDTLDRVRWCDLARIVLPDHCRRVAACQMFVRDGPTDPAGAHVCHTATIGSSTTGWLNLEDWMFSYDADRVPPADYPFSEVASGPGFLQGVHSCVQTCT